MEIILWVLQSLLAVVFIMSGLTKLVLPKEKLLQKIPRSKYSITALRLIGLADVLGGIGLILPGITGIAPVLTAVSAAGLALVMVFAAFFHYNRNETKTVVANVVFFTMAVFVAYYRFKV